MKTYICETLHSSIEPSLEHSDGKWCLVWRRDVNMEACLGMIRIFYQQLALIEIKGLHGDLG